MKAQEILLELGNHLVTNVDHIDFEYAAYYYKIMSLLFTRGEFVMENLRLSLTKSC